MGHRLVIAAVFTAAGLMISGAYAGSPYYDANGQMTTQPAGLAHARALGPSEEAPAVKPAAEAETFDHAVGTDGSSVASGEAAPVPEAAPVYSAAMPKMDADGFQPHESNSSFYGHAAGSDGSP